MNGLKNIFKLASYNFKILFGGKYIIFVILALLLFAYQIFNAAYYGATLAENVVYQNLIYPSLLLIFYPAAYGIQKDSETKILEIFFCIPNYMYKVWLLRLVFVIIACLIDVSLFGVLSHLLLCPVDILQMSYQIMFVVVFFGTLALFLSTVIKSGNGVAVVLIGIFAILISVGESYSNTMWDIMLNPYNEVSSIHPDIWAKIVSNNRIMLGCCSAGLILMSLNNLRRRERML
ncbi:MAG: hypothetical protein SNG14_06240 [Rikenellaceae bacterium]